MHTLVELTTVRKMQVRLALPDIMPDVKRTVRLPEGVTALEKVNAATSSLLTDTDRRVCNEARSMHATFKAVPVRLAGVGVLGIHGAYAKPECAFQRTFLYNPAAIDPCNVGIQCCHKVVVRCIHSATWQVS
jgi:hypothetical protein